MRPKFAIFVIMTAGILVGGLLFLKQQMNRSGQAAPPAFPADQEIPKKIAPANIPRDREATKTPPPAVESLTVDQTNLVTNVPLTADSPSFGEATNDLQIMSQTTINLEVTRLLELSRSSDPQSLPALFEAVNSPNPTIREAALEGIKGKGDTNAIALLKNLAAQKSPDSIQRKELMDAAAFLALPSASDPAR